MMPTGGGVQALPLEHSRSPLGDLHMGWHPSVQRHRRRGRKPWYTLKLNRKQHYLGTDAAEAYRRADELLEAGGRQRPKPISVAGLVNAWTDLHPSDLGNLHHWVSASGPRLLSELAPADLQGLAERLEAAGLSPWTVRRYVGAAARAWRWGHEQGWIRQLPRRIKSAPPTAGRRDESLSKIRAAFSRIRGRAKPLLRFILATGCRPSEARLLEWSEVDLRAGIITKQKHKTSAHGKSRTIYLPPDAAEILRGQRRKRGGKWVFPSRLGKPYSKDGLHAICYRAGLRSVYSLRHTFAQHYLDHGDDGKPGSLEVLQELLGHSRITTTQIYAQIRSRRAKEAARKLKGPAVG